MVPRILAAGLVALTVASTAGAEQRARVVVGAPPEELGASGAFGLLVPGSGSTVTRESALVALARGEVEHALLGGMPEGEPRIELGGPRRDFTIYVTLPPPGEHRNDRRYPVYVLGDGWRGVLVSESTRIPGLVSIADIAPTALGAPGALRTRETGEAPTEFLSETLLALDSRIRANDRARLPASLVLAVIVAALILWRPRAAPGAFAGALAANLVLGCTATSYPADLAYGAAPLAHPVVSVVFLAAGAVVGALIRGTWLSLVFGVVVVAYLLALALDPPIVALSPLGPSQRGRFYGFSNLLETLFLAPLLASLALLAHRRALAVALAAVALVAVAGNRFGADGGGALVLLVAFLVLGLRLRGRRLGARHVALVTAGAVAVALTVVGLDAATGGESHVTRAVGEGPVALAGDVADRAEISARRAVSSWGATAVVVAGIAAALFYARQRPRAATADAALAAVAVSLVVNDVPTDVAGFGALAVGALRGWERERLR